MIAKDMVRKKIFASPVKKGSTSRGKSGTAIAIDSSTTRSGRIVKNARNIIILERLNTAQFDNLLGLETDEDAIVSSKVASQGKKETNQVKETNVLKINKDILSIPNIYNEEHENRNDSEKPSEKTPIEKPLTEKLSEKPPEKPSEKSSEKPAEKPSKNSSQKPAENAEDIFTEEETGNKNHETNVDNSLDQTLPLSSVSMNQSDAKNCISICCPKGEGFILDILSIMKKHHLGCCSTDPKADWCNVSHVSGASNSVNSTEEKEQMVCLVTGTSLKIPLTKKANIAIEVPDGDPKGLVSYLLDCLFTKVELANMTVDGKTKGATQLPDNVASVLKVYVSKKYNADKYNFDGTLFKKYANSKFYQARKDIWKNHPKLKDQIRSPMKKKVKKTRDGDQSLDHNASPKTKDLKKPKRRSITPRFKDGSEKSCKISKGVSGGNHKSNGKVRKEERGVERGQNLKSKHRERLEKFAKEVKKAKKRKISHRSEQSPKRFKTGGKCPKSPFMDKTKKRVKASSTPLHKSPQRSSFLVKSDDDDDDESGSASIISDEETGSHSEIDDKRGSALSSSSEDSDD